MAFNPRELLAKSEFEAIVDSVVNGTTLSLFLMPNHEHVIFRVAACRSPSAKREGGEGFGIEAKEFTIARLLHRTIRVRLCSCNENDLFIGPILDRGDAAIRELISRGLAQLNMHTADLTPSSVEYERCEAEAKARRVKIWQGEKQLEQLHITFEGVVTQILGSCAMLVDVHGDARVVQLSNIATPDFVVGGGSEPLGFETRERLRNLLIGQAVTVVVDGVAEKRYYATVTIDDICVNALLCREGLARVIEPIVGRVSGRIGEMHDGIRQAQSASAGLFAPIVPPPLAVTDLSVTIYPDEPMRMLASLAGNRMQGIIEHILGGNRFVVLVPARNLLLRLAVLGLLPISPSDVYGRQATLYSLRKYLNRNVEFDLREVDKSGGFLATMEVVSEFGDRIDVAKALLLGGLAEVHKRTVKDIPNFDELVAAQEEAKAMSMGKWSDRSVDRLQIEFDQFYPVRVIDVIDAATLTVQFLQAAMKEVFALLPSATSLLEADVSAGMLVCALIDGNRYRGRVQGEPDGDNVRLVLIDFDILVEIDRKSLFELPGRLMSIEPQAATVTLAFVRDTGKRADDREYLSRITRDVAMFMNVVYASDLPAVLLLDKPTLDAGSANAMVIQNTGVVLEHLDLELDEEYLPVVGKLRNLPRLHIPSS
jgi:endonuclease YncB( thermonuclease family)